MRPTVAAIALAIAAAFPAPALAGLFDDEEARQQIAEMTKKTDERFDTAAKAQLDLARQLETLSAEIARLRGQIEVLTHELEAAQKRQRDFYVDLDTRVRTLENPPPPPPPPAPDPNAAPPAPKPDPMAEARDYEAALNLFKAGKYKETLLALETFQTAYPDSTLAPSAQFWIGNSHHALRDCKKTIEAQTQVTQKWPSSPKAPDALLAIATCQQSMGTPLAARKTLESIVARYPDAPAAADARSRLKKK